MRCISQACSLELLCNGSWGGHRHFSFLGLASPIPALSRPPPSSQTLPTSEENDYSKRQTEPRNSRPICGLNASGFIFTVSCCIFSKHKSLSTTNETPAPSVIVPALLVVPISHKTIGNFPRPLTLWEESHPWQQPPPTSGQLPWGPSDHLTF